MTSPVSRILLAFALTLFAMGAQAQDTPTSLPGVKIVSADEAKTLVAKANVFDVRKRASYLESRLPKAKSAGQAFDAKTKTFDVSVFGADKAAPILIYGHGSDGWTAFHAAEAAAKAGFTNVAWMRNGFKEWSEKGNPLEN